MYSPPNLRLSNALYGGALLLLIAVAVAGCGAPAVLIDHPSDRAEYRLEEVGWVRYVADQPRGVVEPTVLRLQRLDGAPVTLADLRALGIDEMDHLRSSPSTPGVAEVHFGTAQSGFAAYRTLLQINAVRRQWAEISLRDLPASQAGAYVLRSSAEEQAGESL